jgi:cytochrome c556
MSLRTACAVIAAIYGATLVSAHADAISDRKQLMKGVGGQARVGAQMVRGNEPFDLAKAQAVFATYASVAGKMPALFPAESKTGGETTAAPRIWEDMDGFKAAFVKFGKEAASAQAAVKDLDSFKALFADMGKNCGGCHENFRIKK